MAELLGHPLVVVTGKGGVGKSTVAAALGLAGARRGLRTIVVEVAMREDVSRTLGKLDKEDTHGAHTARAVTEQLHHISIDPHRAMEEYLRQQVPSRAVASLLSRSRIFSALTAATPGMSELLTIGEVWELAQPEPHKRGTQTYDLVVLDAPATGHGLALLQAPGTFASVARVGPVAKQGRAIASFLTDPRRTAVLAVASAEDMPVTETLELRTRLRKELGLELALTVVNGVVPHRFSKADEQLLALAPSSAAQHAALFWASWARQQRSQIARLRRGLQGSALVALPFVFQSALDGPAIERLSRELDP